MATCGSAGLLTKYLNLLTADKPGRTLAKDCRQICGGMISLQMKVGSMYALEREYITIILTQLLFGNKRFSRTTIKALPLVSVGYLRAMMMAKFYKDSTERVSGRRCTRIFKGNRCISFLKAME